MTTQIARIGEDIDTRFERTAELFKALSHPLRLKLLCGLLKEPRTQSQISRSLSIPASSLSQHVAVLRRTGIVEGRRKQGAELILHVVDSRVEEIFTQVCDGNFHEEFTWD